GRLHRARRIGLIKPGQNSPKLGVVSVRFIPLQPPIRTDLQFDIADSPPEFSESRDRAFNRHADFSIEIIKEELARNSNSETFDALVQSCAIALIRLSNCLKHDCRVL